MIERPVVLFTAAIIQKLQNFVRRTFATSQYTVFHLVVLINMTHALLKINYGLM